MFTGGANVIAVLILLAEFGMLRQALLRDHIRLYMAQSALIAVLAVIVAAARHIPDLYVLAALTVALKVVVIPLLLRRLLRETGPAGAPGRRRRHRGQRRASAWPAPCCWPSWSPRSGSSPPAGSASAVTPRRSPRCPSPSSVVLVAFVLMIRRRDVVSQAIGLFSLENGISLAALVVAASLPLILEVALLFDLLLAVVVFGLLIRMHHGRARSLSTADLTRLRG